MTRDELIARVRTRGGDLRVAGERLQYRPPGVLTRDELDWLALHQVEVARALSRPDDSSSVVYGTAPLPEPDGPASDEWGTIG